MQKVLLVEDDLPLVRMYEIVLKKAGFEVIIALDGEEGLAKIKSDEPSVVLLDCVIPKKDGFSVLKEVKGDGELSKIPICILSVLHQKEDLERAKALGAADFLIKTEISPQEIVEKIEKLIKSS